MGRRGFSRGGIDDGGRGRESRSWRWGSISSHCVEGEGSWGEKYGGGDVSSGVEDATGEFEV